MKFNFWIKFPIKGIYVINIMLISIFVVNFLFKKYYFMEGSINIFFNSMQDRK